MSAFHYLMIVVLCLFGTTCGFLPAMHHFADTASIKATHKQLSLSPFMDFALNRNPKAILGLLFGSSTLPFLVAAAQGGRSIVNFQKNYADAPVPKVPTHGVVVATSDMDWQSRHSSTDLPTESLRLLVIGDSLAVGVGQAVRPTPVMPETIAVELSKASGKAVYWTCFGETGASTPWIIRMIEQANVQKYEDFRVDRDLSNGDYDSFQAEGLLTETMPRHMNNGLIRRWKKKLGRYRQSFRELYFDPEAWGTFDIVVLLTGSNDLKSVFFPFLLDQEDKDLRKKIKNRKGGLIQDVVLFREVLNRKMEKGFHRTLERLVTATEELSELVRCNVEQLDEILFHDERNISSAASGFHSTLDKLAETVEELSDSVRVNVEKMDQLLFSNDTNAGGMLGSENNKLARTRSTFVEPLFALPGSPIRLVPAFRKAPLRWYARPIFDLVDKMKKKYAASLPCDILFVEDPMLDDALDFERRCGRLWDAKETENVLLTLRAITKEDRKSTESRLKMYYEDKGRPFDTINSAVAPSEWPGEQGTNIFSADTIHPNEAGYEMWGRHIGQTIAQRLQDEQTVSDCSNDDALVDARANSSFVLPRTSLNP